MSKEILFSCMRIFKSHVPIWKLYSCTSLGSSFPVKDEVSFPTFGQLTLQVVALSFSSFTKVYHFNMGGKTGKKDWIAGGTEANPMLSEIQILRGIESG